MVSIFQFEHVTKVFNKRKVLDDVTFDIEEGEIIGIIGPSGAGKTTILRTLIGFYTPESGNVKYKGSVVIPAQLTSKVGFATQDECFYDDLSCEENLAYFGRLYGISEEILKDRIPQLLELVELNGSEKVFAEKLSGGMKRRLDLAISLLHEPSVLILDEPSNGLDPVLRKHMIHLVQKINKQGISIIITSHLLEELEQLCTRVLMLHNGKIMATGSPKEIVEAHFPYVEVHLVTYPGNYAAVLQSIKNNGGMYMKYEETDHKLLFFTKQPEELVYAIMRSLSPLREHLIDIDVMRPSLSTVFEQMLEGDTQ